MRDTNIPTAKDFIELPGSFTFKVFVRPNQIDGDQLLKIAQQHLGRSLQTVEVTKNTSKGGKYEAYSLRLHMETYEEIETLYGAFKKQPGVVMTL